MGHEPIDAQTWASWGVDYLKYDNCHNEFEKPLERYPPMRDALNATGRPIFFSLCEWGREDVPSWGHAVGNSWRTTGDISDHWESMLKNLYENDQYAQFAGPGGWNDPDMLEVGNGGMTTTEYISHFSLWCLAKAPLIIGCDITQMSNDTKTILTNTELIAINQDSRGVQGKLIRQAANSTEIWAGPLVDGNVAAILFNKNTTPQLVTVVWDDLQIISSVSCALRDLWAHENLGVFTGSYTATVQPHGVVVLRVVPSYAPNYSSFTSSN